MTGRADSAVLTAALRYAARGLPVFPCNPETKRPLIASETKGEGGLKLATTDADTIRGWWARWPKAMIGMATGKAAGVVVVDLDPRAATADAMLAALARFCGPGALPACPLVRTQSGGLHLWFRYPAGEEIGNRANLFGRVEAPKETAIASHVDVRGEGGYVILPPSRMATGKLYEWEQALFELGEEPFPEAPPRLLDVILRRGEFGKRSPAAKAGAPKEHARPPLPDGEEAGDAAVRKYAAAALANGAARVAQAAAGTRNQMLYTEAMKLGHMIAADALTQGEVEDRLTAAARDNGLMADDGADSVAATIASGFRVGTAEAFDFAEIRAKAVRRAARPRQAMKGARMGARPLDPPPSSAPDGPSAPDPLVGEEGEGTNPRGDFEGEDFDGGGEGADDGPSAAEGGQGGERISRRRVRELAQDSDRLWRAIVLPLNDTGNGRRLLIWFGDELLYVRDVGWHRWAGTHWDREGGDEHALRCAQMIGPLIECEADTLSATRREQRILDDAAPHEARKWADLDDFGKSLVTDAQAVRAALEKRKAARRKFGISTGNAAKLAGMLSCAAPHCTVAIDRLDADPMAFNVLNGTLFFARVEDVDNANADEPRWKLGVEFRPHARGDYITKLAPVVYDPAAKSERWRDFTERFLPKPNVRRFVQAYHGYGLTGFSSAQMLVYYYGRGANGKSVFIETIARIEGNYLQMLPVESLSGEGQRRGDQATPEFARLPGARVVRVSELEKGQKLKEALIKALTGGEPILARHLHKGFFEFRPVFKAVLSSNHKPEIFGSDEGIWRRVNLVPWEVTIPVEERRDFAEVVGEMTAESSGILNWLIEGLGFYIAEGLRPPEEVRAATAEHRADMDPIARFTQHCIEVLPDVEMSADPQWQPPEDVRVYARAMFEAFNRWLTANGAKPWGETAFGRQMAERAETFGFRRFDKRVRYYAPCRLHDVPPASDPQRDDPGWTPPD